MTQRFKRLSHSIYECKYHVVFCSKYRYRIFKDEVGEYVRQQIYNLCRQKELVEVLELNIQPDHIHLVVSIPPKYAVSGFMGYLKGSWRCGCSNNMNTWADDIGGGICGREAIV